MLPQGKILSYVRVIQTRHNLSKIIVIMMCPNHWKAELLPLNNQFQKRSLQRVTRSPNQDRLKKLMRSTLTTMTWTLTSTNKTQCLTYPPLLASPKAQPLENYPKSKRRFNELTWAREKDVSSKTERAHWSADSRSRTSLRNLSTM